MGISLRHAWAGMATGSTTLIVSVAIAILFPIDQKWYALGSSVAFLAWTLPYALFIALLSVPARMVMQDRHWLIKAIAAPVFALLASAFVWILFTLLALGRLPRVFVFNLPMLVPWTLGAVAGFLVAFYAVKTRSGKTQRPDRLAPVKVVVLVLVTPFVCIGSTLLLWVAFLGITSYVAVQHEIFLIPQGHEGLAVVMFDQPNGQPVKYEGGMRVYEIPPDGVLRTQFSMPGTHHSEALYVDQQGHRTEVVLSDFCQGAKGSDTTVVCEIGGSFVGMKNKTFYDPRGYMTTRPGDYQKYLDAYHQLEDELAR
jgi:hypothetical protein